MCIQYVYIRYVYGMSSDHLFPATGTLVLPYWSPADLYWSLVTGRGSRRPVPGPGLTACVRPAARPHPATRRPMDTLQNPN